MKDGVDGGLSAEATGGGGKEVSGKSLPVALMVVDQENHGVVVAGLEVDATDLVGFINDALGEQESHHEDFVIARSAHENRERPAVDDHLEWFLDGNEVIARFNFSSRPSGDPGERR